MSIPMNSLTPPPPTGSSNPVSLRGWFASISTWIRGLSPASATVYDTGWVACTSPNASFNASGFRVRRVGRVILVGGSVVPTGSVAVSSTLIPIAQLPPGFAPSSNEYPIPAAVSLTNVAGQNPNWLVQITTPGVISLRNLSTTAMTLGINSPISLLSGSWSVD